MKSIVSILILSLLLSSCKDDGQKQQELPEQDHSAHQDEVPKKTSLSPHTSAMAMIGDAHIHIDYSSPGVRDRIIFGGLLAYDQVWQAGAHMATWLETNKDLEINGETLAAGKYGLFTIPSKDEWTIIFNRNWDQHGKDEYDEGDDVLRFKVQPMVSDSIQEHLEYKVEKIDNESGEISLAWEKVKVRFPFKLKQ